MTAPRFAVGETVKVRRAYPPGHVRTPYYIRGLTGEVERICGLFRNPEQLAYGNRTSEPLPLYRVRFRQADLWPDYAGVSTDTVEVEVFEHWLERPS